MKTVTPSQTAAADQSPPVRFNRMERRAASSSRVRRLSRLWRAAACAALFGMLYTTLPPLHRLSAQPFRSFEEHSREDADRFVDRASRLSDVDSWSNYVATGIAQERIQWEEEAYAALREEELRIEAETGDSAEVESLTADLQAQFEAARIAWESDATEFFLNERGSYRGEQAAIDAVFATEAEYESLIAELEAQTAADRELDLARWDALVDAGRADIVQRFEDSLTADLDAARAGFSGDAAERTAFEARLDERATELRDEFNFRDHFYILRANNDYVTRLRDDDVSARLLADKGSADAMADQVMAETSAELRASTADMLAEAREQINDLGSTDAPDAEVLGNLAGNFEAQVENAISAGLQRWDQAEEELYRQRLIWQQESQRSRTEGEAVWRANHVKLEQAREDWLAEVRVQIEEGRALWEQKFADFAASRTQAEAQLDQYIAEERQRRTASMDRLGEMVIGGGGALLEAKEAYYYYEGLLAELNPQGVDCSSAEYDSQLYCFYVDQRDLMEQSIQNFQRILVSTEGVLGDLMHSEQGDSGFLNDRRIYAGTLATDIAGLNAGDFENELRGHMQAQTEDYVLYQRDLESIMQSNVVFVARAGELATSGSFDYIGAGDLATIQSLVDGFGLKFDDHRRELNAIIDQDRPGMNATDRLEAVQREITEWFRFSQNREERLRESVLDYFDRGQNGFYLTADENDPYLMTAAELEWERLRRERNYLAKRLQTAEAVKRYADLAEDNAAGLELAQVTAERAEVAKMRRDLRELHYGILKGDVAFNSDPALRDTELERLLSDRGVAAADLDAYESRLDQELTLIGGLAAIDAPSSSDVSAAIDQIDGYLRANVPEDQRENHRLSATREKLLYLQQEIGGGQPADVVANRWTTIRTGLQVLEGELNGLVADYDFDGFDADILEIRTAMGDPTLVDLRQELYIAREQIELNAADLAAARLGLDDAKAAYSRAQKDFETLRAGNSEELIRDKMLETTEQLATILNRMNTIENLAGFDASRTYDLVSATRADYLRAVSDREQAAAAMARSSTVLAHMRGLEEAKTRGAALESALTAAGDLSVLNPGELADVLLAAEANLITRSAATSEEQSFERTIEFVDALQSARDAYLSDQAAYDAAVGAGAAAEVLQSLRAAAMQRGEDVRQIFGLLITNLRGEVSVRSETVRALLDPSAARDPQAVAEEQQDALQELDDRALDLARASADELVIFLETGRETSYVALLTAANDAVAAASAAPRTDGGSLTLTGAGDRAAMRAIMIRDWLLANSDLVEIASAAPTAGDPRTVAEKWDLLIDVVGELAADSAFFESFATDMPDDADHQWVVDFRTERGDLLERLDLVLSAPDGASLAAAYDAMSLADREVLARYTLVSGAALRSDLGLIRGVLEADLENLPTEFRAIFLRESQYDVSRDMNRISRDLARLGDELNALSAERNTLLGDLADLDAAIAAESDPDEIVRLTVQRGFVQDRVDELNPRIGALTDEADSLQAAFRVAENREKEIRARGSSSPFIDMAHALIADEAEGVQLLGRLRESPRMPDIALRDPASEELSDRLKAIVGFYQTDATGRILRDGAEQPLVSLEFQNMGVSDPAADLESVLAGNQRGDDLERWSERLIDWMDNPANNAEGEAEVFAAVGLLANALQTYRDAVAFIENRAKDSATIESESLNTKTGVSALLGKLQQLQIFESKLREASEQARLAVIAAQQAGVPPTIDPATAMLEVLEAPENQFVYHLFRGMDFEGQPDGHADVQLQERVDRLQRLGQALRESRREAHLFAVANRYAGRLDDYVAFASQLADPGVVSAPSRSDFLAEHPEVSADATRLAIDAFSADQNFRTNLSAWLSASPPASALFRDAAVAALAESSATGAVLKNLVLTRIDAIETDINASLSVFLGDMEFAAMRDAQVRVDDRVASALAGLVGLSPDELDRMESDLYDRELTRALYVATTGDVYDAADYPAELRDYILIQSFAQANSRLGAYVDALNSDVPAERESATLDLRGLTGDFARYALALDFENYRQGAPERSIASTVAAARGDGDPLFLSDYIQAYMSAGNLDAGLLPGDSAALLVERAARDEYSRLFTDAAGAGGLHNLDESLYLADFADAVHLAMLADFADRTAFVLTGADAAERRDNYRAHFEAALDDAAFDRDGRSLRTRLLSAQNIDDLFDKAFAKIELSLDVAEFLPEVLDGVDPLAAVPGPDQELPPELLAIAGYASADPRAVLAAASPEYAATLAVLETSANIRPGDVQAPLTASDAEIDLILERAGYTAAALEPAVLAEVRATLGARIASAYFAQVGAQDASGALAALRDDRAARALAGDTDALRDMRTMLAQGTIERLEARVNAVIATGAPEFAGRRNEIVRALAETLYVERGVAGSFSGATNDLFAQAAGLQALLASAASELSIEFSGALLRDQALVERYFDLVQENDADRRTVEHLFADPALLSPTASLDLRFEIARASALGQQEMQRRATAMLATLEDSQDAQRRRARAWSVELAEADALAAFAKRRGDDPQLNRFVSYRTFVGSEVSYQDAQYEEYSTADPAPDPLLSRDEFHRAMEFETASLDLDATALLNAAPSAWMDVLRSDDPTAATRRVDLDGDGDPTNDPQVITVRAVSNEARRIASGVTTNEQLEYMFQESLANNYLEAVTRLNAAFTGVFQSAAVAGGRGDIASLADFSSEIAATGYDVDAAAGANDLSAIEAMLQDASDRAAQLSDTVLQQKRDAVSGVLAVLSQAEQEFADSARRKHIARVGEANFIEAVFTNISNDLQAAEAEFAGATQTGDNHRDTFERANAAYVTALNELADRYQKFGVANDEYERRQAVREFAETPYLLASVSQNIATDDQQSSDGFSADAREEYELALAALENAEAHLQEAGFQVRTEARLQDLLAIVDGLDDGQSFAPLNDAERDELDLLRERRYAGGETLDVDDARRLNELNLREINETYGDVIAARQDHLRHSLRMIRVQKAREVIDAEVDRRRAIVEQRRQAFEQELSIAFGSFSEEDEIDARNAVYQRLVGMFQGGQKNFYDEFRSWYFLTEEDKLPEGHVGTQGKPRRELDRAETKSNQIPALDRAAIIAWSEAGGRLAEYGVFAGTYLSYLAGLGAWDIAEQELVLTQQIFIPMIATGTGMMTAGTALMASIFGFFAGAAMFSAGASMVAAGTLQIVTKTHIRDGKKREARDLEKNATDASTIESVLRVLEKQADYEEALGTLEYFTKAPDIQTVKERIIGWGAQHGDAQAMGNDDAAAALYQISEEDLIYLFDSGDPGPQFRESTGNVMTLTAEQQAEALDINSVREDVQFKDAFGRRYDPNAMRFTRPGPLVGGTYRDGSTEYIRFRVTNHDGSVRDAYAPIIADDAPETSIFDLTAVLGLTADHGLALRSSRRDNYFAAGEAVVAGDGDRSLVLNDRDSAFATLFANAIDRNHGGREFSGYRLVYEEYQFNQREVLERELQQKRTLQLQEWDLREKELNDRYERWDRKMQTLLSAGMEQWGRVNDNYLQEWRVWERAHDEKVEQGKIAWEEKVRDHYTDRTEWEADIRRTAAEKTAESVLTEAVQDLNTQIGAVERSLGMDFEELNATAAVSSVIAEIRRSQPSQTDLLGSINQSVADFSTRIDLSTITGANSVAAIEGVSVDFREEARTYQRRMKILANVKAAEQYEKMLRLFEKQIEVQNRQIENNTRTAALSAGFVEDVENGVFTKTAGMSRKKGSVNKYVYFNARQSVKKELGNAGYSFLEGQSLADFLEEKSTFEIGLYFEAQQLATREVFQRIIGSDPSQRGKSSDEAVIGLFGKWVGSGRVDADEDTGAAALDGFGELGSEGARPGGDSKGFFPQLQQVAEELAQAEQEHVQNLQGPPITQALMGIFNSINPIMMVANTANTIATAGINGEDVGKVAGAAFLNLGKQLGIALGAGLMSMTGVGAGFAAGLILTTVSNMIVANPTTGEIGFEVTPQSVLNSVFAVVGARVGVGLAGGASASQMRQAVAGVVTGFGTSFVQGGMQFRDGEVSGFSWENALASGLVGGVAAGGIAKFGGPAMGRGSSYGRHFVAGWRQYGISQAAVVTGEWAKVQFAGEWGAQNSSLDMMGGDIGSLGSLVGGALGTRLQESNRSVMKPVGQAVGRLYSRSLGNRMQNWGRVNPMAGVEFSLPFRTANRTHQNRMKYDILNGLGRMAGRPELMRSIVRRRLRDSEPPDGSGVGGTTPMDRPETRLGTAERRAYDIAQETGMPLDMVRRMMQMNRRPGADDVFDAAAMARARRMAAEAELPLEVVLRMMHMNRAPGAEAQTDGNTVRTQETGAEPTAAHEATHVNQRQTGEDGAGPITDPGEGGFQQNWENFKKTVEDGFEAVQDSYSEGGVQKVFFDGAEAISTAAQSRWDRFKKSLNLSGKPKTDLDQDPGTHGGGEEPSGPRDVTEDASTQGGGEEAPRPRDPGEEAPRPRDPGEEAPRPRAPGEEAPGPRDPGEEAPGAREGGEEPSLPRNTGEEVRGRVDEYFAPDWSDEMIRVGIGFGSQDEDENYTVGITGYYRSDLFESRTTLPRSFDYGFDPATASFLRLP